MRKVTPSDLWAGNGMNGASGCEDTCRPSVGAELLIRMLVDGRCVGISSDRRFCEEVHLNPAYRWFCRLHLNDRVPDHMTFS